MYRRFLLPVVLAASLTFSAAAPPAWWAERGATNSNPADDYAAVNQGQLKHFTFKAVEELNAAVPGGAGSELDGLILTWLADHPDEKDHDAMRVGQLKWMASKIHARLIHLKWEDSAPAWLVESAGDDGLANLGQLKTVFDFDLSAPTGELPDWWQKYYFEGATNIDPDDDPDGDGLTNIQEVAAATNPALADTDGDGDTDGNDTDSYKNDPTSSAPPQTAAPNAPPETLYLNYVAKSYTEDDDERNVVVPGQDDDYTHIGNKVTEKWTIAGLVDYVGENIEGGIDSNIDSILEGRKKAAFPHFVEIGSSIRELARAENGLWVDARTMFDEFSVEYTGGSSWAWTLGGSRAVMARMEREKKEASARSMTFLKIVNKYPGGTISGDPVITVAQPVTLTIPAGDTKSNLVKLEVDTAGAICNLIRFGIVPDANMVGVIGDVVNSATGSAIQHFVTPKKSTELAQDYVELKAAGVTAETFEQFFEWEGGETGASAEKRKVKRDAVGKTDVKIKMKQSGAIASQMYVWVVWCDGAPPQNFGGVIHSDFVFFGGHPQYPDITENLFFVTPESRRRYFEFTVTPSSIINDQEIPKFEGVANVTTAPGGLILAGGANLKWDVTRRVRSKIENPAPTSLKREDFFHAPSIAVAMAAHPVSALPAATFEILPYPTDPCEGNDDVGWMEDEDNNPYSAQETAFKGEPAKPGKPAEPPLPPTAKGKLASMDWPTTPYLVRTAGVDQETVVVKTHFGEFVRLEIGFGPSAKWYRVSNYTDWKFEAKFKKRAQEPGDEVGFLDDGSTFGDDNSNY